MVPGQFPVIEQNITGSLESIEENSAIVTEPNFLNGKVVGFCDVADGINEDRSQEFQGFGGRLVMHSLQETIVNNLLGIL